jgi:endonuclease YncB( thermonuclease family)
MKIIEILALRSARSVQKAERCVVAPMLGVLLPVAFSYLSFAADISGSVGKVVDGDTLFVCDGRTCEKIRLCGIDAPERAVT